MNNRPNRRLRPLLLVAEATESDYKLLEITLGKEYDLLRANEGCALAELALQCAPDAVLLDIHRPDTNGLETLRELRRRTGHLPLFILTAYAFDTDRRRAEEAGCDALITKPVTPRELKRQLDRCHRQTDGLTK